MSSKHITDEDDLDDLDGMPYISTLQDNPRLIICTKDIVDQFEVSSSKRPDSSETSDKPTASNNTQSVKGSSPPPDSLPEDLAKQLAEGIDALLRDFNGGASGSSEDRKRQEDWEKMLIDGLNGTDDADFLGLGGSKQKSQTNLSASSGSQQQPTGDFQANVLQALEKLKDSDSTLLVRAQPPYLM